VFQARRTVAGPVLACLLVAGACSGDDSGSSASSGSTDIPQPSADQLAAAGLDELPIAPDADRVDLTAPRFSDPTDITNPLFPISDLQSVVFSGRVEGLPFHTETTLLPQTRFIEWTPGEVIEARISQYTAYLDGRLEEVALDYYAQGDDGSVWYLGEDVEEYGDGGFVTSTEGTWLAGRDGPMAMIMPGDPQVGDVFRAENQPGVAFEEVSVSSVDETVDGPLGPVEGAMIASELHDDGTRSDKVFAPGYGEFYSAHQGEIEPLALAVPTDATDEPPPADLDALSAAADDLYAAVSAARWPTATSALDDAVAAWDALQGGEVPRRLAHDVDRALRDADDAVGAQDLPAAGTAAIDLAQSALDLRLRYEPQPDVDRARFELWSRQAVVDAEAVDGGGVRGDITTMELIRDRFAATLDPVERVELEVHLLELRELANDGDLAGVAREAEAATRP
jgi:hypothetical protein